MRFFAMMMLAAMLLSCGLSASAVKVNRTEKKMLVPVGHTVGIKLFAKGVLVVRQPENGTPAETCGLRSGDVIVCCGENSVTSTEQFQSLLQTCHGNSLDL